MEQTYESTGMSVDRAIHDFQQDNRRKPGIVLGIIALGILAIFGLTYMSYRGIPAPENPANARPHLVEPYH